MGGMRKRQANNGGKAMFYVLKEPGKADGF
jgi:hypothetical protein